MKNLIFTFAHKIAKSLNPSTPYKVRLAKALKKAWDEYTYPMTCETEPTAKEKAERFFAVEVKGETFQIGNPEIVEAYWEHQSWKNMKKQNETTYKVGQTVDEQGLLHGFYTNHTFNGVVTSVDRLITEANYIKERVCLDSGDVFTYEHQKEGSWESISKVGE